MTADKIRRDILLTGLVGALVGAIVGGLAVWVLGAGGFLRFGRLGFLALTGIIAGSFAGGWTVMFAGARRYPLMAFAAMGGALSIVTHSMLASLIGNGASLGRSLAIAFAPAALLGPYGAVMLIAALASAAFAWPGWSGMTARAMGSSQS